MGLIHMFNCMCIDQTRDYVKISFPTYIERVCEKHLTAWMKVSEMPECPPPLPTKRDFLKYFILVCGGPDLKAQEKLAKKLEFKYRSVIGEIIYVMSTCPPDLSYAVIRVSQHSVCPHKQHYNGAKHMMKYMYITRDDSLCFWRETPNPALLPSNPPQKINSNLHDLRMIGMPEYGPLQTHGHVDSDWVACKLTQCLMACNGIWLTGDLSEEYT
mmetsp:Transcript_14610/g.26419  ORF Transcript_14610/g.26419 Transcript_14610/m.26419 type:complete len:214 (-) Transcript_14610:23-664(-)